MLRIENYGGREGLFAFTFAQRKSCASLNGNCVLLPNALRSTEIAYFAQRKLRASPNALLSTKIACFPQRKLLASLNGNCVLLPTEIVCFAQRSSLNRNCVLRPTEIVCFAQRELCASLNALRSTEIVCFAQRASLNALRSTEIVCFAQRSSLNANCVFRPTPFAQRKLCASPNATFNTITFSSYSYKRISIFTVNICLDCPSRMPLLSLHVTNNGLY